MTNEKLSHEIIDTYHHFEELSAFEKKQEDIRKDQYILYKEMQEKLNNETNAESVRADLRQQRNNAFFKHMNAVRCYRSEVPYVREFEKISAIDAKTYPLRVRSTLDLASETQQYIDKLKDYINANKTHQQLLQEKRNRQSEFMDNIRNIVVPYVALYLSRHFTSLFWIYSLFFPSLRKTTEEFEDYSRELAIIASEINLLHEQFAKQWPDYVELTDKQAKENLDQFNRKMKQYEELQQEFLHMERQIAEYPSQALSDVYAQFKLDNSKYHLIQLCELAIQCGYETESKPNPLATVVPTLQKLYPDLSDELGELNSRMRINMKNHDRLKKVLNKMIATNRDVAQIEEQCKKRIKQLDKAIEELQYNISSQLLAQGTELLAYTGLISNPLESSRKQLEELFNQKNNEQTYLKEIPNMHANRAKGIQLLETFLQEKSGENLRKLYVFCKNNKKDDNLYKKITKYLNVSYPSAMEQIENESLNRTHFILSTHETANICEQYLRDLKKLESSTDASKQNLAKIFIQFLQEPSWGNLEGLHQDVEKYPDFQKDLLLSNVWDSIMSYSVVKEPFPQKYFPQAQRHRDILSIRSTDKPIAEIKGHEEIPKSRTSPVSSIFSPEYEDFMQSLTLLAQEKEKSTEGRNLNKAYADRDTKFMTYMDHQWDMRGRKQASNQVIIHWSQKNCDILYKRIQKLADSHPLKLSLFKFIVQPTWNNLQELHKTMQTHPGYYENAKVDSLLTEIMELLAKSLETSRIEHLANLPRAALLKRAQSLADEHPLKLKILQCIKYPTQNHLEELQKSMLIYPECQRDDTIDSLLTDMRKLFPKSLLVTSHIEHLQPSALDYSMFFSKALREHTQKLNQEIHTFKKTTPINSANQWEAIRVIGILMLDHMALLVQMHRSSMSQDYILFLTALNELIDRIISDQSQQKPSIEEIQAMQTRLDELAPSNPIRVSAEFILSTALATKEYQSTQLSSDDAKLLTEFREIMRQYDENFNKNPDKQLEEQWNAIFKLSLFNYRIPKNDPDYIHCVNCVSAIDSIIVVVNDHPDDVSQLKRDLQDFNTEVAKLNDHPHQKAILEKTLEMIQDTENYKQIVRNNPDLESSYKPRR